MISQDEWEQRDATAMAQLVASGGVGPRELAEMAIARMEALNPAVNAVVIEDFEAALSQLEQRSDRPPFLGVPYLLKDLHTPARGLRLTNGSRLFEDFVPDFDSAFVARMRAAGFVFLGRTNSPEMGLNVTTEPARHGPTRNPWNLKHSVGGSSGGSAAAVACGMVPVAHATDSGGSIRIPAACCGVIGLKPTRGLNPYGPHRGDGLHGISHENQVTRSVRDMAALLDITAGPDVGAPFFSPPPAGGFLAALSKPSRRLRVAIWNRTFDGQPVDAECAAAVDVTARLLEGLGHHVEEAKPDFDCAAMTDATLAILIGSLPLLVGMWEQRIGRAAVPGDLEPSTYAALERGRRTSLTSYLANLATLQREARRMGTLFETHDILVTPMLARPPAPLGSLPSEESDIDAFLRRLVDYSPFAVPFNATGQPAMSLPLHWSAQGLPIGVQFAGRYGEDAALLQLAAELEQARPWWDRRPTVFHGGTA